MDTNEYSEQNETFGEQSGMLEQAPTAPLSMGELEPGESADPLAGAEGEKRSHAGTLLILVVIVVAGGALFFMRTIARVTAAVTSDGSIESVVEDFLREAESSSADGTMLSGAEDDRVIGVLNDDYGEFQVPLEDVQYNPFLVHSRAETAPEDTGASNVDATVREFEQKKIERRQQIEQAAAQLRLESVMTGGSAPLANIGGKVVREGDSFTSNPGEVEFKVVGIVGGVVSLVAHDERYDLTVETSIKVKR